MLSGKRQITVAALLVVFVTLFVYLPALRCGFINFDDPEYVLNNPVIRALTMANLAEMFAKPHVGWWMPLTWLSLAIDYHFWGLNPVGYHFTNIVFHGINTGLVVFVVWLPERVKLLPLTAATFFLRCLRPHSFSAFIRYGSSQWPGSPSVRMSSTASLPLMPSSSTCCIWRGALPLPAGGMPQFAIF
jgi:hypothetical protein